jgi:ABC-type transporter Mla subunit MlaD
MKKATKTVKFNIVDIVILLLIVAVVAYVLITTFGLKQDKRVNDTVEISFSLTDNFEYIGLLSVGDRIYVEGTSSPLGTVTEIISDSASGSATVKVEALFPHDAQVYAVDKTPILRGESYELKTLSFEAAAELTGIRTVTKATLKNSEEK